MIVVTGSGGVVGTALMAHLRASGAAAVGWTSHDVDLRDADATRRAFAAVSPSLVYHVAGRVHGLMGNRRYPADIYLDNSRINGNVVEAARLAGARKIVAVGTVAIYSDLAPMPVSTDSIWLGPPHGSEASYAHAKRAMLAHLEASRDQYGLDFAYAALTNVYGPNDKFDIDNGHVVPSLIAKFHAAARSGGRVEVWGTGAAERDFIFSRDVARALELVAACHSGPINIATGTVSPIRELVAQLQRISGVSQVDWDRSKPDGQLLRRYDVAPLRALGFTPGCSLAEGLAETYRWYTENHDHARR